MTQIQDITALYNRVWGLITSEIITTPGAKDALNYMFEQAKRQCEKDEFARLSTTYSEAADQEDDVSTLEEWQEAVAAGFFSDCDGSGHWAKEVNGQILMQRQYADIHVPPADATHMVWYNK